MADTVPIMVGDSYLPLFQDRVRDKFVLIEGRRGTAKTRSILTLLVCRAIRYPKSRWLLWRRTRVRLAETVQETLEDQVLPLFRIPFRPIDRSSRTHYDLPGGSKFLLMGMDDTARGQSLEIAGGYGAEAGEVTNKDVVLSLVGAMRQDCGVPYHQMICDVNPVEPTHWSNQIAAPAGNELRAIRNPEDYRRLLAFNAAPPPEGRWKRIITTPYDNPGYFNPKSWEWTPRGKSYYDGLGHLTGHQRKRWLDGLWAAREGVVFPEFDSEAHVIDDFEPPTDWPMVLAFDPGYGTTAVLWIAIAPDGSHFVVDEIYEGGKSMEAHCSEIHRRNKAAGRNVRRYFGDPNEMFSTRAQGPSCAKQALDYGLRFVPWPADKGSAFDAGVEHIRHVLANGLKSPPVSPRLYICRKCIGLQNNLSAWAYKRNANGELLPGADSYEKMNDHAIDCLRGTLQSNFLERALRSGE